MVITNTKFDGVLVIEPKIFTDERGHFFESYLRDSLNEAVGESIEFVQDNESCSTIGVFRGFHFQIGDAAQAKLVRVVSGSVTDIVVNVQTGEYMSVTLSAANKRQLFIPRHYAHGFLSLTDNTILQYKCDRLYNKEAERGFIYDDEIFKDLRLDGVIVSKKDLLLPKLSTILKTT